MKRWSYTCHFYISLEKYRNRKKMKRAFGSKPLSSFTFQMIKFHIFKNLFHIFGKGLTGVARLLPQCDVKRVGGGVVLTLVLSWFSCRCRVSWPARNPVEDAVWCSALHCSGYRCTTTVVHCCDLLQWPKPAAPTCGHPWPCVPLLKLLSMFIVCSQLIWLTQAAPALIKVHQLPS